MNTSITCGQKTRVSRYRDKILNEIRLTECIDNSISSVDVSFAVDTDKSLNKLPFECKMHIKSSVGHFVISDNANSEIRAFNLCFEQLLKRLLIDNPSNISEKELRQKLPYLSIVPGSLQDTITEELL